MSAPLQALSITRNRIVYLDMTVIDNEGVAVESTDGADAFCYLHGRGNLLPSLEHALENQQAGFERELKLSPEQAFGDFHPELVVDISRAQLSSEVKIEVGERIQTHGPHGVMEFKIDHINGDSVRLNANHPLAGKELTVLLKVLDVREPHRDEIRHRRPHPAGHHLMVVGSSLEKPID